MRATFWNFMFENFIYVVTDNGHYEYSREEFDFAIQLLKPHGLGNYPNKVFLLKAIACLIRSIKNHQSNPNPIYYNTPLINHKERHESMINLDLTIKKLSSNEIQEITFKGKEKGDNLSVKSIGLEILREAIIQFKDSDRYKTLLQYAEMSNSKQGKEYEKRINRTKKAENTRYRNVLAANIHNSLMKLGYLKTSSIIGDLFHETNLYPHGSRQTINKMIQRGNEIITKTKEKQKK